MKLRGRDQHSIDIFQLVEEWLSNNDNGKWLIVLDSADDANVFYDASRETELEESPDKTDKTDKRPLCSYLPQSENGTILITTRNKELARSLTGGHNNVIEVGPMDTEDSLKLLEKKGGGSDPAAGPALMRALDFMPLAISQAAAYILQGSPRISIQKYLDQFQETDADKTRLLAYGLHDLRRDRTAPYSIIKACRMTINHIHSERQSATRLLALMSFFDCQGIPDSLIRPIHPSKKEEDAFEADIVTLRNYCLIKQEKTNNTLEMHALTQLSMRTWLASHGDTETFKEMFIMRMDLAFPEVTLDTMDECGELLVHAEAALKHRPIKRQSLLQWASVLSSASEYATYEGRYDTSRKIVEKAKDVREEILGEDHEETIDCLLLLCVTLFKSGLFNEAEYLTLRARWLTEKTFGHFHPNILRCFDQLAANYLEQHRYTEAEFLARNALKLKEAILGQHHPETLDAMQTLALALLGQCRWGETESLNTQVTKMENDILNPFKPRTSDKGELIQKLMRMHNSSYIHWRLGQWGEAAALEVQVLEVRRENLGPRHPDTLASMYDLAWIRKTQARDTEAIKLMEECVNGRIQTLGPEHHLTKNSKNFLDEWYLDQIPGSEDSTAWAKLWVGEIPLKDREKASKKEGSKEEDSEDEGSKRAAGEEGTERVAGGARMLFMPPEMIKCILDGLKSPKK